MANSTFYLTFDDGPYEVGTAVVLKVLKKYSVEATFFLCANSNSIIAKKDKQYELISDMISQGHALANHGDDHKPLTKGGYLGIVSGKGAMSKEEKKNFDEDQYGISQVQEHVLKDFEENGQYFEKLFASKGAKFPGFIGNRLPGDGRFQTKIVKALVEKTKLPHFGWHMEFAPNGVLNHVAILDWNNASGASGTMAPTQGPKDQFILLLHDSHWAKREDALDRLVGKLKELGEFKTLKKLPASMSEKFKGAVVFYEKPPDN
jgi:peptidoglycan/xylan/chitin deacetylase (PgdA/CDA1 family)